VRIGAVVLAALAFAPACRRSIPACPGGARFALEAPAAPVGFDAEFTVVAKPLCEAARAGAIRWSVDGVTSTGWELRARTPKLNGPVPWGVIPLSPRTQGEISVVATWRQGRDVEDWHEVTVVAAPRARGLASTALGTRVYLGPLGAAWRLEEKPAQSATTVEPTSGAPSLVPDVAGDYHLVDGAGRGLTLRAARYDETPLDCARGGCHPTESRAAAASPMTTVLARGLTPAADGRTATFGAAYPGCALACHTTGEPRVEDGGFANVARELGVTLEPRPWDEVPRALRRLGGVGCLSCHGPGALPETSARWAILRTDLCATCHDAPPRYGHVAAWRGRAMSRADRDPRATQGACARCHTTWGFLAAQNVGAKVDRRPPDGVGAIGIACAACHAPHDARATTPALVRATRLPPLLADGPPPPKESAICLPCHAPDPAEPAPAATAAALWLGRGGLDPATGARLDGPRAHAGVARGCLGCHREGPRELERGAAHAFEARREDCGGCHRGAAPAADDVRTRAAALWTLARARLGARGEGGPPHARASRFDLTTALGRAAWDVALVVEDPAAAAHNAPYARQLLAAAEKTINGGPP
jgi:hypothetical protein